LSRDVSRTGAAVDNTVRLAKDVQITTSNSKLQTSNSKKDENALRKLAVRKLAVWRFSLFRRFVFGTFGVSWFLEFAV
jgi:hypothetical protein